MQDEKRNQIIKHAAEKLAQGYLDFPVPMYGDAMEPSCVHHTFCQAERQ